MGERPAYPTKSQNPRPQATKLPDGHSRKFPSRGSLGLLEYGGKGVTCPHLSRYLCMPLTAPPEPLPNTRVGNIPQQCKAGEGNKNSPLSCNEFYGSVSRWRVHKEHPHIQFTTECQELSPLVETEELVPSHPPACAG